MPNVLITSASRKVSLVRAFQSALAKRAGGNVIAVDVSPYAPALYVADRNFLIPRSNDPEFMPTLLRLCEVERITLIVPTRDEELPLFAEARPLFEKIGARVLVSASETIRNCQDKSAFIAFCREHGIAIPKTFQGDEWRQSKFPFFVKPRSGKGGIGARMVATELEMQTTLEHPGEWIIQECVDAPEYTVDLLADFEGRVISAVPRLRRFVVSGESYVSITEKEPTLIEESIRLATKLHLIGHNTIQCFWDGQQVKFIEVNPRFGGAAALGIAAGADTPSLLLRLLDGESVPSQIGQFESNLTMLRYTDDLFLKSNELTSRKFTDHNSVEHEPTPFHAQNDGRLQAVLFDLDNTLYPEDQFVRGGFLAVARSLGEHLGLEPQKIFERMLEILHSRGRGRVFDVLLDELKVDSKVWVKALLLIYRSHHPDIALFPGIEETLNKLKNSGVRLGLVSDGLASVQKSKIAALGLKEKMDVIICTDELGSGCSKPSTVPFEVALALLGIKPGHAAYVADDVSKDFVGPNRLGMKTIRVCSDGLIGVSLKTIPEKEFQPQIEIDSLSKLLQALQS